MVTTLDAVIMIHQATGKWPINIAQIRAAHLKKLKAYPLVKEIRPSEPNREKTLNLNCPRRGLTYDE